jgi:hypothetical protein
MIELDGIEYSINTAEENATKAIDYVNNYCKLNNIVNSSGEIISIDESTGNPLYLLFLANGYLTSILQRLLYSVGAGINTAASSDRQLLNIASMANLKRLPATYTTINCLIYCVINSEGCHIAKSLSAKAIVNGQAVTFHPAFDIDIPSSESRLVPLIADTTGPFLVPGGTIKNFEEDVPGFARMVTDPSVPGKDIESIASLRARIQARDTQDTSVDKAIAYIRQLPGVSHCYIYFNYDDIYPVHINGVDVQPRRSIVYVQGYNDNIAFTYFKFLNCQTTQPPPEVPCITQNYTFNNGQQESVYLIPPDYVEIFIRVQIKEDINDAMIVQVQQTIVSLALDKGIADMVTSSEILELLRASTLPVTAMGCDVSRDGIFYTYVFKPEPNEIVDIKVGNIQVDKG